MTKPSPGFRPSPKRHGQVVSRPPGKPAAKVPVRPATKPPGKPVGVATSKALPTPSALTPHRDYGPDLTAASVRRLLGKSDANILEIGANDGTDTVEFLKQFPNGRLRCFECDARAIAAFRSRVPVDPRVTLHDFALGAQDSVQDFYPSGGLRPGKDWVGTDWNKSGSLLKPDQHSVYEPWLKFGSPINVSVRPLDDVIGDDPEIIDFAWVDVQGAEAQVLRGAAKTIAKIRWWYCECMAAPFYHGQATINELLSLLPWFVLHSHHQGSNYLFRNTRL